MTATSASTATGTSSPSNPPFAQTLAHVRIPGSNRTYEVRDVLRGMGLRWDPLSHAWHGTLPVDQGSRLHRDFGLKPQIVPTIEAFASESTPEPSRAPAGRPEPPRSPIRLPRPHDGSRTRAEARLAFPGADDDPDEFEFGDRRFSLLEITSGLPDDSREEDERAAERLLRDLCARVKAARAAVSTSSVLAEALQNDRCKAAWFYARFGITEGQFKLGVPSADGSIGLDPYDLTT